MSASCSSGTSCPKIVRVYSDEVEQKDFPTYRSHVTGSKMPSAVMIDIALHHKIRGSANQFSDSIQEQDMLLQLYPDDIGQDQMDEYMATVMKAEVSELQEADIIMCRRHLTSCHMTSICRKIFLFNFITVNSNNLRTRSSKHQQII
jgi:hypothetical protein